MRLRHVIMLAMVLMLLAVGMGAFLTVRRGFSAHDQPTAVERTIANLARRLAVPARAKALKNPLPETTEALAEGRRHWADHCALCHANNGSGDTEIGENLYPKPPDMRQQETQDLSDGELYYWIQNGIRLTGMPAWGSPDDDNNEESWKLVLFIRHLPKLTHEEEKEMERYNPKSAAARAEEEEIEEFLRGGNPPASNTQHQQH